MTDKEEKKEQEDTSIEKVITLNVGDICPTCNTKIRNWYVLLDIEEEDQKTEKYEICDCDLYVDTGEEDQPETYWGYFDTFQQYYKKNFENKN